MILTSLEIIDIFVHVIAFGSVLGVLVGSFVAFFK